MRQEQRRCRGQTTAGRGKSDKRGCSDVPGDENGSNRHFRLISLFTNLGIMRVCGEGQTK